MKEKPINDPEKLLQLIKDGDAEMLLAEGNLGIGFNKLINLDLILIDDGKVSITPLGEEALTNGIESLIPPPVQAPEVEPVFSSTPVVKSKPNGKKWLLAILLLLLSMILIALQMPE